MRCWVATVVICCVQLTGLSSIQADPASGPGVGQDLKSVKVFVATGDDSGKEKDFVKERKEQPTVFVFVPADKFTRPMARFLKKLDEKLESDRQDVQIIIIWLTDDQTTSRERLPKIQESLKMQRTTWTVFVGDKNGPPEWGVNPDADITVVIANGPKSTWSDGYRSINETEVPKVFEKLPVKKS